MKWRYETPAVVAVSCYLQSTPFTYCLLNNFTFAQCASVWCYTVFVRSSNVLVLQLFLMLNDTAYSQVTFTCQVQVVNTTAEARDAAENPVCDFSSISQPPPANNGGNNEFDIMHKRLELECVTFGRLLSDDKKSQKPKSLVHHHLYFLEEPLAQIL